MKIEISNGELLDKFSILEIKSRKLNNELQLANVIKELKSLSVAANSLIETCMIQYDKLKTINEKLWTIEDQIRSFERENDFGDTFVSTARKVYLLNDERALIKKEINMITGSDFLEEKSYQSY